MMKMTNKEFKEVLNTSGLDFDIYGYEGILNILSMYYMQEAIKMEELGMCASAKADEEIGRVIFRALKERGYFD